jgi:hypothetical protein
MFRIHRQVGWLKCRLVARSEISRNEVVLAGKVIVDRALGNAAFAAIASMLALRIPSA